MNRETSEKIYSVSELTRLLKGRLESEFQDLWVEGQVFNYRGPAASGHCYFSLKDETASLRAVLFKGAATRLAFELEEGLQILARGRLSVYESRGEYQLVVGKLIPKGMGALQLRFEQLKRKLEAEGLFDPARKRALPAFPKRVAVITSPSGAVIRDILHVTARRCPWVDMLVLPVRVQGEGAAGEIAAALRWASQHLKDKADLVLLARGGGSLEDLWAFNDEEVARAIAACAFPVISAVGHEVDFCIADFVADLRAPTPSAAAEILSPSRQELEARLAAQTGRLRQASRALLASARAESEALRDRLARCHPRALLESWAQRLDDLVSRLSRASRALAERQKQRLMALAGRLQALSPLAILSRGYAVCFNAGGRVLRAVSQVSVGDAIQVRLGQGAFNAEVRALRS